MSFISLDLQSDPAQLLDTAVDSINTNLSANGMPGWTSADATLAVIVLAAVTQLIADGINVSSQVLSAIWRAFGTQLMGVPFQNGTTASVLSTWTFTSPAPTGGYFIPGQTTVIIDGQPFYTQNDTTTAANATVATITLVSAQAGTIYNNLGGVNAPAELQDGIDWVSTIVTQGITSGGQDQEDDPTYQNRLVGAAQLQAPRPLVATDFAQFLLSDVAENATGVAVGRATSTDGYYPDGRLLSTGGSSSPSSPSCNTTNGSATITLASPPGNQVPAPGATVSGTGVPSSTFTANTTNGSAVLSSVSAFTAVGVGTQVSGAGIPAGAVITAVNTGASTATMSVQANTTASGITVTPTQTVVGTPTESTFTISVNCTATGTASLTISSFSGYGPTHLTCSATTTNASVTVSIVTPPYLGAIPDVGARVRGAGIPSGATVAASPAPTSSSFALSAAATSSNTAETVTISSWTSVQLTNTAFVTDASGLALSAASMDALATWLAGYRPQNWLTFVTTPSYTTIYVSVSIHVLTGYDSSSVSTAVQNAILTFLSPATWGSTVQQQQGSTNQWLNTSSGFNVVRLFDLVGVVKSVSGVQYIPDGGITLGTAPSPAGTSDITLSGPAPLPLSTAADIVVTVV